LGGVGDGDNNEKVVDSLYEIHQNNDTSRFFQQYLILKNWDIQLGQFYEENIIFPLILFKIK
jgi:hypothetical protein